MTERLAADIEQAAIQRVIEELTRLYLSDVHDPLTRAALEAASVVRCVTQSLLKAMLPNAAPQDAFERLHGHDDSLLPSWRLLYESLWPLGCYTTP